MEAWQIVSESMERGDGERLAEITEKSAELFNSYGRRPKTEDYANGTGNVSPVEHYMRYIALRIGANIRSARKLHLLVTKEVEDRLGYSDSILLRNLSNGLLQRIIEALRSASREDVEAMDERDLILLDGLMADLENEAREARGLVRAELRRKQSSLRAVGR